MIFVLELSFALVCFVMVFLNLFELFLIFVCPGLVFPSFESVGLLALLEIFGLSLSL